MSSNCSARLTNHHGPHRRPKDKKVNYEKSITWSSSPYPTLTIVRCHHTISQLSNRRNRVQFFFESLLNLPVHLLQFTTVPLVLSLTHFSLRPDNSNSLNNNNGVRDRQFQIRIYNQRRISSMRATQSRTDHRNHRLRRFLPD